MSEIKAVLFDIGNVLMLADHNRTIEAFIAAGVYPNRAKEYFNREDYITLAEGRIGWEDYCELLRQDWLRQLDSSDIFQIHACHIYAIDNGVYSLIQQLREKVPIIFVTNTCYPEWEKYVRLDNFGIFQSYPVWRSDKEHCLKSQRGVLDDIIGRWIPENARLRLLAHEVLFIDDSESNLEAASRAGICSRFNYPERRPWRLEQELRKLHLI
jgi:FMN phosphatase YigB (HAD superfamily)